MNSPMAQGGYFLIDEILDAKIDLPAHLNESMRIQRANSEQIQWLKRVMVFVFGEDAANAIVFRSENAFIRNANGVRTVVPLPEDEWRYFVIAHIDGLHGHVAVNNALNAMNVVTPSIASRLWCTSTEPWGTGECNSRGSWIGGGRHRENLAQEVTEVDNNAVDRWRGAIAAYSALDREKYPGIVRALELFARLRHMEAADDIIYLGLFIVIEMLLTHNPNDKEIGDSLNHQIGTKVPLLSRRMPEPLDYTPFAEGVPPSKIWKALYAYRSAIAHGELADFSQGRLAALRNGAIALEFMRATTRKLLRFALDEPALLDDLKHV